MENTNAASSFARKAPTTLLAIATVLCATQIFAQSGQATTLEPGYWEVVTTPEFRGIPFPPLPKTDQFCLTSDDIQAGRIPLRSSPDCSLGGGERAEGQLMLTLNCKGEPPPATSARITEAGKNLSGYIEISPRDSEGTPLSVRFIYRHVGKWLNSDCPAPAR